MSRHMNFFRLFFPTIFFGFFSKKKNSRAWKSALDTAADGCERSRHSDPTNLACRDRANRWSLFRHFRSNTFGNVLLPCFFFGFESRVFIENWRWVSHGCGRFFSSCSRWQTLGVPSALTPIGQLHQSPPSPVPGDLGRCPSHQSHITPSRTQRDVWFESTQLARRVQPKLWNFFWTFFFPYFAKKNKNQWT